MRGVATVLLPNEQRVDEAVDESFPASDSPDWSPTHAGPPVSGPPASQIWPVGQRRVPEAREQILLDLERLGRRFDRGQRSEAREELLAQAILDAGGIVALDPIDGVGGVGNVEAEETGSADTLPCVVVGARYDVDDVTRGAMLAAVLRAVKGARLLRTVRFVGFADSPVQSGAIRYAERLERAGVSVHAMLSLADLGMPQSRVSEVAFAFPLRSWSLTSVARNAFRNASAISSRMVPLPQWWPSLRATEHVLLSRRGWPTMMVTDSVPGLPKGEHTVSGWRPREYPDVDSMAAAAAGIAAAVKELANMPAASL